MIKAALVNTDTKIVENIIMVNSLEDVVPEGYVLAPMEYQKDPVSRELTALQKILKENDPNFIIKEPEPREVSINIGVTKWDSEKKYYEE
jgi:hypothetical protein